MNRDIIHNVIARALPEVFLKSILNTVSMERITYFFNNRDVDVYFVSNGITISYDGKILSEDVQSVEDIKNCMKAIA